MCKKLTTVVLFAIVSAGSCAVLATVGYALSGLAEELMTPALQAFVNARSPFVSGQIPF